MKYKRQLMGSMFVLALLATTGTLVFAADAPSTTVTKTVQQKHQIKMKAKNPNTVEIKNLTKKDTTNNSVVKKVKKIRTHKTKTTTPVSSTTGDGLTTPTPTQ